MHLLQYEHNKLIGGGGGGESPSSRSVDPRVLYKEGGIGEARDVLHFPPEVITLVLLLSSSGYLPIFLPVQISTLSTILCVLQLSYLPTSRHKINTLDTLCQNSLDTMFQCVGDVSTGC